MESVFSWFVLQTIGILSSSQWLKAVCEVLGNPGGSALELPDGTLKLRHCTQVFTMRFQCWSLPRVGNGGGKRQFITPGDHLGKRVRLTRKTRPGVSLHGIPDLGHPTPNDGELMLFGVWSLLG